MDKIMYNAYIKDIMPIPIEKIEISPNNNYMYRITAFSSLVDENKRTIDKILRRNKRIKSYEGWWLSPHNIIFKQALIEFKKEKVKG